VKKSKVLAAVAMTVALFASTAIAAGVIDGSLNPNHVPGESLDSGLGELSQTYTAKEFDKSRAGEKSHVDGEKIDSGLGDVSSEEIARIVTAALAK
jgi:hypothetical protein